MLILPPLDPVPSAGVHLSTTETVVVLSLAAAEAVTILLLLTSEIAKRMNGVFWDMRIAFLENRRRYEAIRDHRPEPLQRLEPGQIRKPAARAAPSEEKESLVRSIGAD